MKRRRRQKQTRGKIIKRKYKKIQEVWEERKTLKKGESKGNKEKMEKKSKEGKR